MSGRPTKAPMGTEQARGSDPEQTTRLHAPTTGKADPGNMGTGNVRVVPLLGEGDHPDTPNTNTLTPADRAVAWLRIGAALRQAPDPNRATRRAVAQGTRRRGR